MVLKFTCPEKRCVVVIQIPKNLWEESWKKWIRIIQFTDDSGAFPWTGIGFYGSLPPLNVVESCGYCKYVKEIEGADCKTGCPLRQRNICTGSRVYGLILQTTFWLYIKAMNRGERTTAFGYAKQILTTIEDDGIAWGYITEKGRHLKKVA